MQDIDNNFNKVNFQDLIKNFDLNNVFPYIENHLNENNSSIK